MGYWDIPTPPPPPYVSGKFYAVISYQSGEDGPILLAQDYPLCPGRK